MAFWKITDLWFSGKSSSTRVGLSDHTQLYWLMLCWCVCVWGGWFHTTKDKDLQRLKHCLSGYSLCVWGGQETRHSVPLWFMASGKCIYNVTFHSPNMPPKHNLISSPPTVYKHVTILYSFESRHWVTPSKGDSATVLENVFPRGTRQYHFSRVNFPVNDDTQTVVL